MRLTRSDADCFVPAGSPVDDALRRTTHLAVGAHQDDIEFMAIHGILACFGRDDRSFTGVTVTDGAGSPRTGPYAEHSDDEMRRVRRDEQRRAAVVGAYGCQIQLAHPSAAVKNPDDPDPAADLGTIFELARPSVVYLHNPADKHDTHVACCLRGLAALRSLPTDWRPAAVYGCEVWRDLDWLVDDDKVLLPIADPSDLAASLAAVFDSQIAGGKRYDLAVAGRRRAEATFSDPHSTDRYEQLTIAMDLTPLIENPEADIAAFTTAHLRRTERDIFDRIDRLGGGRSV
jgi:LmbE family N-acetylglucosaminyl deacetylase